MRSLVSFFLALLCTCFAMAESKAPIAAVSPTATIKSGNKGSNKGGMVKHIELFFTEDAGVYVSTFDTARGVWNPPQPLPGLETTAYAPANPAAAASLEQYGPTAETIPTASAQANGAYIWTADPPVPPTDWNKAAANDPSKVEHDPQNYSWPRKDDPASSDKKKGGGDKSKNGRSKNGSSETLTRLFLGTLAFVLGVAFLGK